jgi:hypothetical protein
MSSANPTYDRKSNGILFGLVAAGGFVAIVAVMTAVVLGAMLATGTLRHTSQGWSFQASANSPLAGELRNQKLDPKVDSLFVAQGSGSSHTATFTARSAWRADWTYSCPTDSSSFQVVAQGSSQSYLAGSLGKVGNGAGNSNLIAAGTYSLTVTTDPGCSWGVGARPSH